MYGDRYVTIITDVVKIKWLDCEILDIKLDPNNNLTEYDVKV